jgi:hypothetical protein
MLTRKAVLLHHLEYTFEKEAWQPSLAMAVDGVTATQAAWKPAPERHSIWQIVRHVSRWKQATLDAWDGTKPLYLAGHGETDYARGLDLTDWHEISGDETAWRADVQILHAVSTEIRRRVEALAVEEELLQPFPGEDMPAVLRLVRMATHDIYHAGQIRYLRALQQGLGRG